MLNNVNISNLSDEVVKDWIRFCATERILSVNAAADFLLEACERLCPDTDPYDWDNIETFKADLWEPEMLMHYGLDPDATGWYYITLQNEVFSMNARMIKEIANVFLAFLKTKDTLK